MGRKLDVDQLVGASEIAQRLGLRSAHLVHDWRNRYDDFPKPVARFAMGLVWYWPEVARWAKQHRPS